MAYRVTSEEVLKDQNHYKKNYPPFVPFNINSSLREALAARFENLIKTQNGQDTDDYSIGEGNKVQKALNGVSKGSKVLILGVGTGREVLEAKDMGMEVVGTTLGSRNVYFGRKYLGLTDEELLECLNEVLPFPSNTFDLVLGFQVFEHTFAPLLFLLEQRRVLKNGGKLLLEWPPADKYTLDDNPHHQVCFTPGQAEGLFKKAGFSKIRLYFSNGEAPNPEELWQGDHEEMALIEGIKVPIGKDYINRSEKL